MDTNETINNNESSSDIVENLLWQITTSAAVMTHYQTKQTSLRNSMKILPLNIGITDWKKHGVIHATVFETVRRQNFIDRVIHEGFGKSFGKKLDRSFKNILRVITYIYLYAPEIKSPIEDSFKQDISAIPELKKYKDLITDYCLFLEKIDQEDFLSRIKDPIERIAVKYYHPTWLVRDFVNFYGKDETLKIIDASNRSLPMYLRLNLFKHDKDTIFNILNKEGVKFEQDKDLEDVVKVVSWEKPVPRLDSFKKDFYYVQNKGSSLITHVLDPKPGEYVLDACAAPGGKTFHIAALQEDQGVIVSSDINYRRLTELVKKIPKYGLKSINPILLDWKEEQHFKVKFDKILVDAPCSGTGTFGSRPDTKWRINRHQMKLLSRLQRIILERVTPHLSDEKGACLVYATCSMHPMENEAIITDFLEQHPLFELKKPIKFIGKPSPRFPEAQRLFPHLHDTEGFAIFKIGYK